MFRQNRHYILPICNCAIIYRCNAIAHVYGYTLDIGFQTGCSSFRGNVGSSYAVLGKRSNLTANN